MKQRLQEVRIRTPEGAEFSYCLASPVLRMAAVTVDWMALMVAWGLLQTLLDMGKLIAGDWAGWFAIISYFLLLSGYDILCEWLWRGQTLGKRVFALRVVDAEGLRLTFSQIVMRNIIRYLDVLPGCYFVGGLSSFFGRKGQRLGDVAAGTLVIWERPIPRPDLSILEASKYNSLRQHSHSVGRLRQAITPEQALAAWQALKRRDKIEPQARVRLFAEMAAYFKAVTHLPDSAVEGVSDEQLVRNVVEVLYKN